MKNKKVLAVSIIVLIIVIILIYGGFIFYERIKYAITDAVFVESDNLTYLSFKRVGGKIKSVLKDEGDFIKKGEILAKLEDKDYLVELNSIKNKILSLYEKKKALEIRREQVKREVEININISRLNLQNLEKNISSLEAKVKALDREITQLERDEKRFKRLLEKELISKKKYEDIKTRLDVLKFNRLSVIQKLEALKVKKEVLKKSIDIAISKKLTVEELDKEIKSLEANIKALEDKKKDVELKINYTKLKSPVDGVIAKKFRSVGEVVASGMPIFAVIPKNSLYILVLLEEGKLRGIKVGNKAYIKIDAFPDREYIGVVEEINPSTASKFALVPRDITAGEFTKVEQRIPVKIKIIKGDTSILRVGMGGEIKIERK